MPVQNLLVKGFTVDMSNPHERDDGFLVLPLTSGKGFRLFLAIANVASVIEKGSEVDRTAMATAYSVFSAPMERHLFPRVFRSQLSLNRDKLRAAVILIADISLSGEVSNVRLTTGSFLAVENFSFRDINRVFQSTDKGKLSYWRMCLRVAELLQRIRLHETKPNTPKLNQPLIEGDSIAERLVEEFMLFYNMSITRLLRQQNVPLIFRTAGDRDGGYSVELGFCPIIYSPKNNGHPGLGLQGGYCTFTSPIRRFVDLVNQRQVVAFLGGTNDFYSQENISAIVSEIAKVYNEERILIRLVLPKERENVIQALDSPEVLSRLGTSERYALLSILLPNVSGKMKEFHQDFFLAEIRRGSLTAEEYALFIVSTTKGLITLRHEVIKSLLRYGAKAYKILTEVSLIFAQKKPVVRSNNFKSSLSLSYGDREIRSSDICLLNYQKSWRDIAALELLLRVLQPEDQVPPLEQLVEAVLRPASLQKKNSQTSPWSALLEMRERLPPKRG
jgi:hypothetical protein